MFAYVLVYLRLTSITYIVLSDDRHRCLHSRLIAAQSQPSSDSQWPRLNTTLKLEGVHVQISFISRDTPYWNPHALVSRWRPLSPHKAGALTLFLTPWVMLLPRAHPPRVMTRKLRKTITSSSVHLIRFLLRSFKDCQKETIQYRYPRRCLYSKL